MVGNGKRKGGFWGRGKFFDLKGERIDSVLGRNIEVKNGFI